jgi:hypothetical protein
LFIRHAIDRSKDMKWAIAVMCILVLTPRASGQTTSTYNTGIGHATPMIPTVQSQLSNTLMGVVIESWRYDPSLKAVILRLVNQSHKDATAFNISIAEKYADGSTSYLDGRPSDIHDHQLMEDMLGRMINIQLGIVSHGSGTVVAGPARDVGAMLRQGVSSNGTFAAGTSFDYPDLVGKEVSGIDAVVDVVAYADGTAQVQNNDRAFRNLLAERKGPQLAMQKVVGVIKQVLGDPMVTNPLDSVIQQLTPLVDSADKMKNLPPEDAESNVGMHLQSDLTNFQMVQRSQIWLRLNMTEREWLTQYVEHQEKQIALMAPHADLHVDLPELR